MRVRIRGRRGARGGKFGPLTFRLLGLFFMAFPVLVAFMFLRDINLARSSATWPTVSGVVTNSKVVTYSRKGKTRHRFDIAYEFVVSGQSYSGSRVRFGGVGTSKATAEDLVKRYPAGSSVTVHYFPDDPAECTLETGAAGEGYAVLIFPGMFFLIGIGMLIGSFYLKAPQATAGTLQA
jgi:hypothetical protein